LSASRPVVFDWLLALSGLAALFTWGSICLAHIRFRAAWKHHGHTVDEIPFKAAFGVYGSYAGLFLIFLVLVAQVSLPTPFLPPSTNHSQRSVLHRTLPPQQERTDRHR
jgi:amino acid permease